MSLFEWIQAVASAATALGVGIAAVQLWQAKQQEQSQFEDSLSEQYREVSSKLPLPALLGRRLDEAELQLTLRIFYEYFDLSNEQAFLAYRKRLRYETWDNWREGIEQHLSRPAFRQAWACLEPELDGSFDSLRKLLPVDMAQDVHTHHGPPSIPWTPDLRFFE